MNARPFLNLDFKLMAQRGYLDPILTFSRDSVATRINPQTGLIESVAANVPRLEKNGLLIEGESTNLLPFQIQDAAWGLWDCTWGGNAVAPDGRDVVAYKLGDAKAISAPQITIQAGRYTASIWVRRFAGMGGLSLLVISSDWSKVFCDVPIPPDGGLPSMNYWQRVTASFDAPGGSVFLHISGVANDDVVAVACAQIESGPVATSYIPTTGTPATRAAEVCRINNVSTAPWCNRAAGTLVVSASPAIGRESVRVIEFGTDGWQTAIFVQRRNNGVRAVIQSSPTVGFDNGVPNAPIGVAISWTGGHAAMAFNGVLAGQSNNVLIPPLSDLAIGCNLADEDQFNGNISCLQILPYDVPDTVLKAMSTLT